MTSSDCKKAIEQYYQGLSEDRKGSALEKKRIEGLLMSTIQPLAEEMSNAQITREISLLLKPATRATAQKIKSTVLENIAKNDNQMVSGHSFSHVLFRKSLSIALATLILTPVILTSFQTFPQLEFISHARAAFIECSGQVFVNGSPCLAGRNVSIHKGDQIETSSGGTATVYHSNFARTYLDSSTKASVVQEQSRSLPMQIFVDRGKVWHYSPSDLSQLQTASLSASVFGGAISLQTIEGNRGKTEVFATVPFEVRIDDSNRNSTSMTLLDDELLAVYNRTKNFRKERFVQNDKNVREWVHSNEAADEKYVVDLRQSVNKSKELSAGDLPGQVSDSLGKFAQSAKLALTPGRETRRYLQLSMIDELFSEALLLSEKGDQTTAEQTFQYYREKFISLLQGESDILVKEDLDGKRPEMALFEEHYGIISLSQPTDSAYFLKNSFEDLALELEPFLIGAAPQDVVDKVTNAQLIEAHRNVQKGNMEIARERLQNYKKVIDSSDRLSQNSDSTVENIKTEDLVILDDIARKSTQLQPIVSLIKQKKVQQIENLASSRLPQQVTSRTVVGTAYREPESEKATTKIVGQAREDEAL